MKSILLNGRNDVNNKRLVRRDEENNSEMGDVFLNIEHDTTLLNDSIEEEDDDYHFVRKNPSISKIEYIDENDTDSIKSLIELINKKNITRSEHKVKFQANSLESESESNFEEKGMPIVYFINKYIFLRNSEYTAFQVLK